MSHELEHVKIMNALTDGCSRTLNMACVKLFLRVAVVWAVSAAAYAQPGPSLTCSLSTPLGPTARATASGHTEPIAAGPSGIPPTPGGGALRVTCSNTGATFIGTGSLTI